MDTEAAPIVSRIAVSREGDPGRAVPSAVPTDPDRKRSRSRCVAEFVVYTSGEEPISPDRVARGADLSRPLASVGRCPARTLPHRPTQFVERAARRVRAVSSRQVIALDPGRIGTSGGRQRHRLDRGPFSAPSHPAKLAGKNEPNGYLENLGTNSTAGRTRETKPISEATNCGTNPMAIWVEFCRVLARDPRKMGAWGVRNRHRRPHQRFVSAPSLPTKCARQNEPNGYLENLGATSNTDRSRETKPISGATNCGTNPMAIWVDPPGAPGRPQ